MVAEALPMTKRVEIINKKEFAVAVLNVNNETFIHIAALEESTTISIHHSYQAQVTLLTNEETKILAKYFNFSNVFSSGYATELLKYTEINDHPIDLLDNK